MTTATVRGRCVRKKVKNTYKAIFVTSSIGDYHVARFEAIASELCEIGWSLEVLATVASSEDYKHRMLRPAVHRSHLWRFEWELVNRKNSHMGPYRTAWEIFLRLIKKRSSIIFCVGYISPYSLAALLAAKWLRVPVIFSADSKFDDGNREPAIEFLKSLLVGRFNGAIVASEKHAVYYRFLGVPPDSIRIGYDVVDNAFFSSRASWARRHSRLIRQIFMMPHRYALCVSRLIPKKRVDRVIRAYAASSATQVGIHLAIVGDGPEATTLHFLTEFLGVQSFVHFIPAVPNEAMPLLYGLSEFVVLGSDYDQWGLCLNEALASGTPVICTAGCGAAGELIRNGEGGLVVQPLVEDLAEKIEMMLNDERRSRLAEQAGGVVERWGLSLFAKNVASYCSAM